MRNFKSLIFLLLIAAAAFLARAGSASQTTPPIPVTNPPASAPQPAAPAAAAPARPSTAPFVVVIDPAHGGADAGAHGSTGIDESDVVLSFARQIRAELQEQGVSVVMTRDANVDPSFDDRSTIVNAQSHAIFVSLHVSSTGIPGTVRVYSLPSFATEPPTDASASQMPPPIEPPNPHPGLRNWDTAQDAYIDLSRHLATLLQTQLTQRFRGSPISPATVAVRQLRTIAAPAVAIEVSSVAVADRKQLDAMAAPLADGIVHAVLAFVPTYVGGASVAAAAGAGAQ